MKKVIPISAVLLLSFFTAYAQDYNENVTTTPATNATPNATPDMNTPANNGTIGSSPADNMNNTVTTTPVATPASPVTTSVPSSTTGATNATTSSMNTTTGANAFTCSGANPNWNLSISKNFISFSTAKNNNIRVKASTPISPIGDTTGNLQVYSTRTNDDKPVMILVKKNNTGCSSGMPGQSYQYDTFVVYQNKVVSGCCNPT